MNTMDTNNEMYLLEIFKKLNRQNSSSHPSRYADWGQVLSFARNWITSLNTYWYIIVWPGLTLVFFVMGWNLVGDALRDVLDPRMRGKT